MTGRPRRRPHGEPPPTERCREPRCPCQRSPLWRDRTPDEDADPDVDDRDS